MYEFGLGLELMAYGLTGVFAVLILFFIVIKLLLKVFPYKGE
ncbi:MAG TPA: OadG-related small transporter subunit [Fusibacter sp.]|nr:OadG-related small transporter subunit [Fusibacter sp.]